MSILAFRIQQIVIAPDFKRLEVAAVVLHVKRFPPEYSTDG